MKKVIIFLGLFLMFSVTQAQQPQTQSNQDPNMKKGVLRTGSAKNGCDTAHFVDRPGEFYDLPKVDRRGKRLKFHLNLVNKVLGCGTSDEEALLQVTIHWQSDTTDFMPKIIERGVMYWYDPDYPLPEGYIPGTIFHKIDESLNDACSCDSTFYVMLDGLVPGTHYITRAYVIKYSSNPSSADTLKSDKLLLTHEREKCIGWKSYAHEVADDSGIELVYDHEGNDYGVTQIGNQCWLRENVRCNTSPNGYLLEAPVNYATGDTIYYKVSDQVPYYYVFDALTISYRQRGNLYNWASVVDTFGKVFGLPQGHRRGICPEGWHVPNNEEWFELVNYVLNLGNKTLADFHNGAHPWIGDSVVKFSFGCGWPTDGQNGVHYSDANPGGYMDDAHVYLRNTTGFSAMPTNNVQESGKLGYVKEGTQLTNVANYWLGSPSETQTGYAYSWHIDEDQRGVSSFARTRKRGFSVRCIRDALTITPYPNSSEICLNDKIIYTPKVANEDIADFSFKWNVVDKNGQVDAIGYMSTGGNPSFVFQPTDTGYYRIECNAIRGTEMNLLDSVFVHVTECPILTISPSLKTCIGETATVMAHLNEPGDIKWSVNDTYLEGENEALLTYTFPMNQDADNIEYTFKFYLNSELRGSTSIIVSKSLPALSVCPDCDRNGFVIKGSKNMDNNDQYARWYVSTPHGDSTVTYAHAVNTVVPAVPGVSYSVAMASPGGCHDTLRGLVLTTHINVPCEPLNGIKSNEIADGNGKIVSVEDHEHNRYVVEQIGNRCWMKENMRAITSPTKTNGQYDTILARNVSVGNTAYQSYVSQVAHWYRNDSANYSKFGLLYNWCAAADVYNGTKVATETAAVGSAWIPNLTDNWRGICPEGWHLPSIQDFAELENDENGNTENAGKLAGGCDWTYNDTHNSPGQYYRSDGDDWGTGGFDALPAGEFVFSNTGAPTMQNVNKSAYFWTSTQGSTATNAYFLCLLNSSASVDLNLALKYRGKSVRCVRNIPNWPPYMTVCYGIDPGVINITSHVDLDSVAWCRSDGYTVSCKLSESQQATLLPGKYAVRMFNNMNPSLCHELDSITINTACKVQTPLTSEREYASGYIDSVSDMSDNWYPVVEINGQCWMRTNMRTTRDNQGNPLTRGNATNSCTKGKPDASQPLYYDVCKLDNNNSLPLEYRGYLYNWNTAHSICPEGWHLSTKKEWEALYNVYPNKTAMLAGDCSSYWGPGSAVSNAVGNYNVENRNISGFSLVAAGNMSADGVFGYTTIDNTHPQNPSANLWADVSSGTARVVFDYHTNELGQRTNDDAKRAFSVRCVRNNQ